MRLRSDIPIQDLESLSDTANIAKHVVTLLDQIKYLRAEIENTIELSKIKGNKAAVETSNERKFQNRRLEGGQPVEHNAVLCVFVYLKSGNRRLFVLQATISKLFESTRLSRKLLYEHFFSYL